MASQEEDNKPECVSNVNKEQETYIVNVYKKNEHILNDKNELFENKVKSMIEIWRSIGELNLSKFDPRHVVQIMDWAKLHALDIVLTAEWNAYKASCQDRLLWEVEKAQNGLLQLNGGFAVRCKKLADVVRNPWEDPILMKLMKTKDSEIGYQEIEFFCMETAYLVSVRLKKLCESQCEDLALNLAAAFIKCNKLAKTQNFNLNASETHMWFIFDIYIALLYKFQEKQKIVSSLKELTFEEGLQLIKRFSKKRIKIAKIWKNCQRVAILALQMYISRVVLKLTSDLTDVLNDYVSVYLSLCHTEELLQDYANAIRRISNLADASGLYIFSFVTQLKAGVKLKPFVIEMYIRGLTTDMNDLERRKDSNETQIVSNITTRLAKAFCNLGEFLNDHVKVARECVLTAFSLEPTEERLKMIENLARRSGFHVLDTGQEWKCKSHPPALPTDEVMWQCPDCGDWMCKPQLKLTKINMALNEALQNSVLGISEALCDDLVVCLSNPRYQVLSWFLPWEDLHRICIMYLKHPQATKNFITELKFIDIDYTQFKDIKPEPIDDLNGIERGYEQYVDISIVACEESIDTSSEDSISHDCRTFNLGIDDAEAINPISTLPVQQKSDPDILKSLRMFRPNLKRREKIGLDQVTPKKVSKKDMSSVTDDPSTSNVSRNLSDYLNSVPSQNISNSETGSSQASESKNVQGATLPQLCGQVAENKLKSVQVHLQPLSLDLLKTLSQKQPEAQVLKLCIRENNIIADMKKKKLKVELLNKPLPKEFKENNSYSSSKIKAQDIPLIPDPKSPPIINSHSKPNPRHSSPTAAKINLKELRISIQDILAGQENPVTSLNQIPNHKHQEKIQEKIDSTQDRCLERKVEKITQIPNHKLQQKIKEETDHFLERKVEEQTRIPNQKHQGKIQGKTDSTQDHFLKREVEVIPQVPNHIHQQKIQEKVDSTKDLFLERAENPEKGRIKNSKQKIQEKIDTTKNHFLEKEVKEITQISNHKHQQKMTEQTDSTQDHFLEKELKVIPLVSNHIHQQKVQAKMDSTKNHFLEREAEEIPQIPNHKHQEKIQEKVNSTDHFLKREVEDVTQIPNQKNQEKIQEKTESTQDHFLEREVEEITQIRNHKHQPKIQGNIDSTQEHLLGKEIEMLTLIPNQKHQQKLQEKSDFTQDHFVEREVEELTQKPNQKHHLKIEEQTDPTQVHFLARKLKEIPPILNHKHQQKIQDKMDSTKDHFLEREVEEITHIPNQKNQQKIGEQTDSTQDHFLERELKEIPQIPNHKHQQKIQEKLDSTDHLLEKEVEDVTQLPNQKNQQKIQEEIDSTQDHSLETEVEELTPNQNYQQNIRKKLLSAQDPSLEREVEELPSNQDYQQKIQEKVDSTQDHSLNKEVEELTPTWNHTYQQKIPEEIYPSQVHFVEREVEKLKQKIQEKINFAQEKLLSAQEQSLEKEVEELSSNQDHQQKIQEKLDSTQDHSLEKEAEKLTQIRNHKHQQKIQEEIHSSQFHFVEREVEKLKQKIQEKINFAQEHFLEREVEELTPNQHYQQNVQEKLLSAQEQSLEREVEELPSNQDHQEKIQKKLDSTQDHSLEKEVEELTQIRNHKHQQKIQEEIHSSQFHFVEGEVEKLKQKIQEKINFAHEHFLEREVEELTPNQDYQQNVQEKLLSAQDQSVEKEVEELPSNQDHQQKIQEKLDSTQDHFLEREVEELTPNQNYQEKMQEEIDSTEDHFLEREVEKPSSFPESKKTDQRAIPFIPTEMKYRKGEGEKLKCLQLEDLTKMQSVKRLHSHTVIQSMLGMSTIPSTRMTSAQVPPNEILTLPNEVKHISVSSPKIKMHTQMQPQLVKHLPISQQQEKVNVQPQHISPEQNQSQKSTVVQPLKPTVAYQEVIQPSHKTKKLQESCKTTTTQMQQVLLTSSSEEINCLPINKQKVKANVQHQHILPKQIQSQNSTVLQPLKRTICYHETIQPLYETRKLHEGCKTTLTQTQQIPLTTCQANVKHLPTLTQTQQIPLTTCQANVKGLPISELKMTNILQQCILPEENKSQNLTAVHPLRSAVAPQQTMQPTCEIKESPKSCKTTLTHRQQIHLTTSQSEVNHPPINESEKMANIQPQDISPEQSKSIQPIQETNKLQETCKISLTQAQQIHQTTQAQEIPLITAQEKMKPTVACQETIQPIPQQENLEKIRKTTATQTDDIHLTPSQAGNSLHFGDHNINTSVQPQHIFPEQNPPRKSTLFEENLRNLPFSDQRMEKNKSDSLPQIVASPEVIQPIRETMKLQENYNTAATPITHITLSSSQDKVKGLPAMELKMQSNTSHPIPSVVFTEQSQSPKSLVVEPITPMNASAKATPDTSNFIHETSKSHESGNIATTSIAQHNLTTSQEKLVNLPAIEQKMKTNTPHLLFKSVSPEPSISQKPRLSEPLRTILEDSPPKISQPIHETQEVPEIQLQDYSTPILQIDLTSDEDSVPPITWCSYVEKLNRRLGKRKNASFWRRQRAYQYLDDEFISSPIPVIDLVDSDQEDATPTSCQPQYQATSVHAKDVTAQVVDPNTQILPTKLSHVIEENTCKSPVQDPSSSTTINCLPQERGSSNKDCQQEKIEIPIMISPHLMNLEISTLSQKNQQKEINIQTLSMTSATKVNPEIKMNQLENQNLVQTVSPSHLQKKDVIPVHPRLCQEESAPSKALPGAQCYLPKVNNNSNQIQTVLPQTSISFNSNQLTPTRDDISTTVAQLDLKTLDNSGVNQLLQRSQSVPADTCHSKSKKETPLIEGNQQTLPSTLQSQFQKDPSQTEVQIENDSTLGILESNSQPSQMSLPNISQSESVINNLPSAHLHPQIEIDKSGENHQQNQENKRLSDHCHQSNLKHNLDSTTEANNIPLEHTPDDNDETKQIEIKPGKNNCKTRQPNTSASKIPRYDFTTRLSPDHYSVKTRGVATRSKVKCDVPERNNTLSGTPAVKFRVVHAVDAYRIMTKCIDIRHNLKRLVTCKPPHLHIPKYFDKWWRIDKMIDTQDEVGHDCVQIDVPEEPNFEEQFPEGLQSSRIPICLFWDDIIQSDHQFETCEVVDEFSLCSNVETIEDLLSNPNLTPNIRTYSRKRTQLPNLSEDCTVDPVDKTGKNVNSNLNVRSKLSKKRLAKIKKIRARRRVLKVILHRLSISELLRYSTSYQDNSDAKIQCDQGKTPPKCSRRRKSSDKSENKREKSPSVTQAHRISPLQHINPRVSSKKNSKSCCDLKTSKNDSKDDDSNRRRPMDRRFVQSVLANVPGLNDLEMLRPSDVNHIVNVVQVSVSRTTQNIAIQNTSTQVTPHIQRIGQPRLGDQKPDPISTSPSSGVTTIPTSTPTNTKNHTSQPSTLINILSQQVIGSTGSAVTQSNTVRRQAPVINILSQQIIRPSQTSQKSSGNNINTTTSTTTEVPSQISQVKSVVTSAISSETSNVNTIKTTTAGVKSVSSVATGTGSTILQFFCKSSLPKFQQAFGKTVYHSNKDVVNCSTHNVESNNSHGEIKKTVTKAVPVNIQPLQGSVIYSRQVPVGQTISLIPPGGTARQVFRIATSNPEQISLVKDSAIHSRMSALLAAALQNRPKNTEDLQINCDEPTKVTLTRPALVQNARIVKPVQLQLPTNVRSTPQTNLSSTTLEQLREFDMVYKQIKERGSSTTTEGNVGASENQETQPQRISVTYVNQLPKYTQLSPVVVVTSYSSLQPAASPALSVTSQGSSSPCLTSTSNPTLPKIPTTKSSKGKTLKSTTNNNTAKSSPIPKPQQKPQEDEHTTQRIFDILAEYAEQLRNSPDLNNKPAPRRRSNPPTNPSQSSKRKKSSNTKKSGQTTNAIEVDTDDITVGSEDSSGGGIIQLSVTDDEQSQAATTVTTSDSNENSNPSTARPVILNENALGSQPRNVIIADSTVGEALKMPNTAVIVPGSYIMPVSMVKGGQQIAVVSGGSKILATVPARSGQNMLLFQSFTNQNRKGAISAVKYSTVQPISGISSQSLAGVSAQPPVILPSNSVATAVALGQPITLKKVEERDTNEIVLTISPPKEEQKTIAGVTQMDGTTDVRNDTIDIKAEDIKVEDIKVEDSKVPSDNSNEKNFQTYQKSVITNSTGTSVIATCSNIKTEENNGAQSIINVNLASDNVKSESKPNTRIQSVLVTACTSNGPMFSHATHRYKKPEMVRASQADQTNKEEFVHNGEKTNNNDSKTYRGNANYYTNKTKKTCIESLKVDSDIQKQAVIERELRLQKSLSEECEDLGVDEPSTSDLFPEADLLFDSNHSPSFDQTSQDIIKRSQSSEIKEVKHLFSDDETSNSLRTDLFEYVEYHTVDSGLEYQARQLINNGNVNSNESGSSGCEDNTLLPKCTAMSDVTLNSPISPEMYQESSLNKYKFKYSNKKKCERIKATDFTEMEPCSEEVIGNSEMNKVNCEDDNLKLLHLALNKNEDSVKEGDQCELHCGDGDQDSPSGRGARRSVRKLCSCCNGSQDSNISKKRPHSSRPQTPSPHKKAFLGKKR